MAQEPEKKGTAKRLPLKPIIAAVVVIAAIAAGYRYDLPELLKQSLEWIKGLGLRGYAVFVVLYILSCVFFVPGTVLTLGAGVIYGVVKGSLLVSASSTLGATAAFLVGRYAARSWVSSRIDKMPKFKAVDTAVSKQGWKIVGLLRLSPLFPFNFLNYAFGITGVKLRDYFLASWIGMIPGTIVFVYVGWLIGDIATLGAEGREREPAELAIYVVGLLVTVIVTVYITRLSRKALDQVLKDGEPDGDSAER